MRNLQLTIERSDRPGEPKITASYNDGAKTASLLDRSRTVYSIPPAIPGIETAVTRLQTDLFRGAGIRRAGPEQAGSGVVPDDQDVPQTALATTLSGMGEALFRYLFDGPVEALYRGALKDCEDNEDSLRVTLVLADDDKRNPLPQAPWLNLTPWETLWDTKEKEFLSTAGSIFFSRAVGEAVARQPRKGPLRILIMAAAPQIFEGERLDKLNGFVEVEKIRDAVRGSTREVEIVPGESLDDLQQVLFYNSSEQRHFDVFHFIGHGDLNEDSKEGYLLFKESDGANGVPIYANQLKELLSDPWAPLLVVLNSCRGAQGYAGDMFSSTAATLSLGRVPAVVAMQFPITDRAAIVFSRSLYQWLVQGATVQDAVRRARRSLKALGPEWITPVLYLRSPDCCLVGAKGEPGTAS
jgi:CHAT domain